MLPKNPTDLSLLLIRIGLGVIFFIHGLQKLGVFNGPGVENFSLMMESLDFTPPIVWAYLVSITETVSGLMLILGVLPRINATAIAIIALVAMIKVHGPHGFFVADNGIEFILLILLTSMAVMLAGGGRYTLIKKTKKHDNSY